jgi:hypothetical protein
MDTVKPADAALDPKFDKIGYKDQVLDIINSLTLNSETDKHILKSRFLYEVLNYDARRDYTKKYYNGFRFTVTVGSILLPAILSIGQMDPDKLPDNFDDISYWTAWSISLMVTVSNGFLQLFSLDKNYFEYAITSEQLKTEGWQFLQLSGKYDEYPDHKSAYRPFCKSIELIKRKQVEKEFSGKAEVKKKKEFDFAAEFKNALPEQFGGNPKKEVTQDTSVPDPTSVQPKIKPKIEPNLLSLLGSMTPDSLKGLRESVTGLKESVSGIGAVVVDAVDDAVVESVDAVGDALDTPSNP